MTEIPIIFSTIGLILYGCIIKQPLFLCGAFAIIAIYGFANSVIIFNLLYHNDIDLAGYNV